ncbi:MAG: MBL fold metallo-hydrolase [Dehalococcoidia bacterium]|nr:MBL fold metallo-hydrolase [Dehalococcoidia bacterium]
MALDWHRCQVRRGAFPALLLALVLLVAAACQPQALSPTELEVHFVDVGQGDGILVRVPGGGDLVIDGGRRSSGFADYLARRGVRSLAIAVATNPDADHIGGLVGVLKALRVEEVWLSGQPNATQTYEDFVDAVAAAKARTTAVRRGQERILGGARLTVLHPLEPLFAGRNNNSVVVRLDYGEVSFLFMGDAERAAEESMLGSGLPLRATVLKMGHHGSRTSSSPPFVEAVAPQYAVYQAGRGNPYGHPHAEALASVRAAGASVLGTAVNGTIVIRSDGRSLRVRTER